MTPIVDTGPLVALLDRSDRHHRWAREVFSSIAGPVVSCEAVVAEVLFLCRRNRVSARSLHLLLTKGTLRVAPVLAEAPSRVVTLLERYASVPMSLADACLMYLHDEIARSAIVTCDGDFRIYRRSRGRPVEALAPVDLD